MPSTCQSIMPVLIRDKRMNHGPSMPFLLLMASVSTAIFGQTTYCAFTVHVKSESGKPVAGVAVWLLRDDGTKYAETYADNTGIARLCDTPPGLVDIQVGSNLCGATAVKYLQPSWLNTRNVYVTFEGCEGFFVDSGCYLTLRVTDSEGRPVSGARLLTKDRAPPAVPELSDEYGRLFGFVGWGDSLMGTIERAGYFSVEVARQCKSGQQSRFDLPIILRRRIQR
jgi:hypothetical protein